MKTARLDPILVDEGRKARQTAPSSPGAAKAQRGKKPAARRSPAARRMAVGLVVTAVGAVIAARGSAVVFRPLAVAHRADVEIADLSGKVAAEETTQRQLRERLQYLRTPTGVEEEARRQGWVRGGETSLMLLQPEPKAPAARKPARR